MKTTEATSLPRNKQQAFGDRYYSVTSEMSKPLSKMKMMKAQIADLSRSKSVMKTEKLHKSLVDNISKTPIQVNLKKNLDVVLWINTKEIKYLR